MYARRDNGNWEFLAQFEKSEVNVSSKLSVVCSATLASFIRDGFLDVWGKDTLYRVEGYAVCFDG
jgi:hypothetical protein